MEGLSFGWLFVKTIIAMIAVIALAIWGIRHWMPRLQGLRPRPDSVIQILERFGLEPRKALYIIQIGKKRLLLGVSENQINKLADLDRSDVHRSDVEEGREHS